MRPSRFLPALASAWLLGCDGFAAKPSAPAAKRSVSPAGKWACTSDSDCMNSCAEGAVSKAWYMDAGVAECFDGCANQLAAAPKCVGGDCVAFRMDPSDSKKVSRFEACTRRR